MCVSACPSPVPISPVQFTAFHFSLLPTASCRPYRTSWWEGRAEPWQSLTLPCLRVAQSNKHLFTGRTFTLPKSHINQAVKFCPNQQPWLDYQDHFISHFFNRQLFFLNIDSLKFDAEITQFSLIRSCHLHHELSLQFETETSQLH